MTSSEFIFIETLRAQLADRHAPNRALAIPPGDDTAELQKQAEPLLFAADMLMDGVHFDLSQVSAEAVGRKALAVNLSDIAAMAGTPTAVVVSLALPRGKGQALADGAMRGLMALAAEHDVAIAGGDTNSWAGAFVINVAIVGKAHERGSVTRGGARPGDVLFVTGALGGSIFGRHLSFAPRLAEARRLHADYGISAMLDLSDGLGSDLRHILAMSACGARLDPAALPIHPDALRHGPGKTALQHALEDGEDFELCFAMAKDKALRLIADKPFGDTLKITQVGEIVAEPGLRWKGGEEIASRGYVHDL